MNGPHWIKQWIADLALLNDQFRNEDGSVDFSALGREEYQFRMALITRKFSNSERAKDIFEKAKAAYEVNVERGKKGGRPRKETTADGDTREDSQDRKSGTSANHSATTSCTDQNTDKGRTGAPVRGTKSSTAPVRPLPMPSKEQLYDFARAESLDEADARDWYEMTVVDRSGNDRKGRPITNWKAALKRFCKSRADRRTA